MVQSALRRFAVMVPLGSTRGQVKEILRAHKISYQQRCCFHQGDPDFILVEVGQQDAPWYCSAWIDYVVFEFSTAAAPQRVSDISDSDVLKLLHLFSGGEGCL